MARDVEAVDDIDPRLSLQGRFVGEKELQGFEESGLLG